MDVAVALSPANLSRLCASLAGLDAEPVLLPRPFLLPGIHPVAVMPLPDLVTVTKTRRDRDWPMIRCLVEADLAAALRLAWLDRGDPALARTSRPPARRSQNTSWRGAGRASPRDQGSLTY